MSIVPPQKLNIKDLDLSDRPRERGVAAGISNLSTPELLAILIGSGNKQQNAVQLSQHIMNHCNNDLNQLAKLSLDDLKKFNGIGDAKAINILAALELSKRRTGSTKETQKISSSKDVYDFFSPFVKDLNHEEFWILILNKNNKPLQHKRISSGGFSSTVVDIKLIAKYVLDYYASAVVLVHNHPSESVKPSNADISITKKIKDAMELLEITVLDHIIVAGNNYFSFRDDGIL